MRFKPKGRIPSLLAWGLLVGGVALLVTVPTGPTETLRVSQLPAAFLFALAGLVFGLAHPEDGVWASGVLLGWVPLLAGGVVALEGAMAPAGAWLALTLLPAALAGAGAWTGARLARRRLPTPRAPTP